MFGESLLVRTPFVRGLLSLAFIMLLGVGLQAQDVEDFYARMLEQEVEVVNPVKRPVIGLGAGILFPLGDIRYASDNLLYSSWAVRMNVTTLVGASKQVKLNVSVLYGILEGHDRQRSLAMNREDLPKVENMTWYPNSAFQTEVIEIGLSAEYNFWHLIGTAKNVRPYLSAGLGLLIYTPKANYRNPNGDFYHFWDDGTIRLVPQSAGGDPSTIETVRMDRVFETDVKLNNVFGLKSIPPATAVIPFEAGVDIYVSDRVVFRPFVTLHYSFSDLLDGFNGDIEVRYGRKTGLPHDMFLHTGISFHFDFFSQAESFIVDRVFADIEDYDYEVFFADQDGDGIFDHIDRCPDTPLNIPVDTVGCPFDSDGDGVPDYLDREPQTPAGNPVDEFGESLDDAGRSLPKLPEPPVHRKDIKVLPVSQFWNRSYRFEPGVIPDKFRGVDINGDGEISYEEVIRAVDDYFTGRNDFTPDDIYELNAYFFAQ